MAKLDRDFRAHNGIHFATRREPFTIDLLQSESRMLHMRRPNPFAACFAAHPRKTTVRSPMPSPIAPAPATPVVARTRAAAAGARVAAAARAKLASARALAVVACGAAVAACGGPGQVVIVEAPINVQEVVLRAETGERLKTPLRVVFDWEMAERGGARVDGRGAARLEPPYKARLDLFLGNGEQAGSASLVDDDLRLPTQLPPSVLPPANLLWAALGVFRPGLGTGLLGAERVDGRIDVRYALPGGDEAVFRLFEGRIERVEVTRNGTVVQRLTVERDALGVPVEALFRDLVDVRELKLVRASVAQTEPFPPDIWRP